jgi:cation/acetate symporter
MYNGLATAADWMSAASFIGTAGVLYLQGFAGLAYILGWTGGYCLLALLLAPYLRRFGQYTVPDFLGARYGGQLPRLIGAGATVAVSFVYLVVQIYGVGLITSHLTGFGFELGIFVGLGGVLVCSFLGGMRAVTWTQVAQYLVLIVAYLLPLTWLSVKQTGSLLPVLTYGAQLEQVQQREKQLLIDPAELEVARLLRLRAAETDRKLLDVRGAMAADAQAQSHQIASLRAGSAPLVQIQRAEREYLQRPRTEAQARAQYVRDRDAWLTHAEPLAGMPPQALPFAAGDPKGDAASQARYTGARVNFIALMLCLMMGTAAMPHVLTRYYTTPSPAQARSSVAWSLFFITLLYVAAPALAVLVKYEVLNHLVGMPIDQLPQWVTRWSRLDPNLLTVRDINGDGLLQLGELFIGGDVIVLAAPEIGGLPYWVTCLVAAGGLAAALSTADGLLLTIANALSHDVYFRVFNPRAGAVSRVIASKMLVMVVALLAALIAALKITDILQFVSAAFSLAAAAFFPALVMGIFWRRANHAGAVAGMLAGLGLCVSYMATNLPWLRALLGLSAPAVDSRWMGVDAVAAGVFGVPAGLAVLVLVSLLSRTPDAEQMAMVDRLRVPAPDER